MVAFDLTPEREAGAGWVRGEGKSAPGRGDSMCEGPKVRITKLNSATGSQGEAGRGHS